MLLQERTIAEQLREKQRRKEEEERENMAIAKYLRDKDEELERRCDPSFFLTFLFRFSCSLFFHHFVEREKSRGRRDWQRRSI